MAKTLKLRQPGLTCKGPGCLSVGSAAGLSNLRTWTDDGLGQKVSRTGLCGEVLLLVLQIISILSTACLMLMGTSK